MFANGDVANANQAPSKMIDIPNLINYYVSQGFNSVDIKEMLPEVPMAVIESAVNALGGSVNPSIASPGADEFSGNINPFVEVPETRTLVNEQGDTTINPSFPEPATPPELPSEADISMIPEDIRRYMEATAGLFDDNGMVTAIMMNFDLSEEEARRIVGMSPKPDTAITSIDPSLEKVSLTPKEDDLPDVADTQTSSSLKKLQIKDKKTNSIYTLPENFEQQVKEGMIGGTTLYSIINNIDFEFSPDVAAILENFANMDEPFRVSQKIGGSFEERRGTFAGPGDFGYGAQEVGRQFANIAGPALEGVAGFFGELGGGAKGRQAAQDFIPDVDISKSDIGLARLLQIPGVSYTPPEVFDATKELEEIAKEEAKPVEEQDDVVATEETPTKEETPTTDDDATGTSKDPAGTGDIAGKDKEEDEDKDKKVAGATTADNDDNDTALEISNSIFGDFGRFFNSDANLRLMRNVGKGLTQYGNFAEGIGVGTAAASEERKLEEELEKKRLFDLAEATAGEGIADVTDRKKILDVQTAMNDSIANYNNAVAAEELTTGVLDILADPSSGNITTFSNKIGIKVDEFLNAAGVKSTTDIEKMKPGKRAKVMLKVLTNRNIKEILGESGRTISNIDREVAERIMSSLELFKVEDDVATMKLKLQENLRSITTKKNLAQRNIKNSVIFLAPYDENILARDSELFSIYVDELGFNLPRVSAVSAAPGSDSDAIFIDDTK